MIADAEPEKIPALYKTCIQNGVEVHTVDHKEYSTFLFPAVAKKEPAPAPSAVQRIKEIPAHIGAASEQLTSLPKKLLSQTEFNPKTFAAIYKSFLEAALKENRLLSVEEMEALAQTYIK